MVAEVVPANNVISSRHAHGVVIFHMGRGRLFASNHTGADIWRKLEERRPLGAISRDLSDRYRISSDAAWACTTEFVAALERESLVERRHS
jgi:hypothetical protein